LFVSSFIIVDGSFSPKSIVWLFDIELISVVFIASLASVVSLTSCVSSVCGTSISGVNCSLLFIGSTSAVTAESAAFGIVISSFSSLSDSC